MTASTMPSARLWNELCITSFWPRIRIFVVIGRPLLTSLIAFWMSAAIAPRSRPSTLAAMSISRCTV